MADVSVVIPTYNESKSVGRLARLLQKCFADSPATLEIIVVDDNSPDGTAEVARALPPELNVKVFVRTEERGLATAVVHGWKQATGRYLAVIDGDLQHPPDVIRKLYETMEIKKVDLAVASRKVPGGGTYQWESSRKVVSSTAILISKLFLPFSLWGIKDTTTGCFMLRRECINTEELSPQGFKIFIETVVRGKFAKTVEVPYVFNQRGMGESKMSFKQDILFLWHLFRLGLTTGEASIPWVLAGMALTSPWLFL